MQIGTQLGTYEILSAVGKGGMGEVWKARDRKLGRDVAIKTLPPEFSRDAERLARFEREARLLASVNHPNIGAIYGLEDHDSTRFLVLEYVEGGTLAERIAQGAMPSEEAVKLALQIADALEAAHEKGVIHRDLKPANIKVTPDGQVKVLDFGLAKTVGFDESTHDPQNSPTLSGAATQQGWILGTPAYMSPEQAKGRSSGRAADIWAFGCVLFEMLAGRPAFAGEDISEILAAVIRGTADLSLLPPDVRLAVRRVIGRCLEKDLKKRFRDIGDTRFELVEASNDASDPAVESARRGGPAPRRMRARVLWPVLALLGMAAAGIVGWSLRLETPTPEVTRFERILPEEQAWRGDGRRLVSISRNGRYVAYNTSQGIMVRAMDSSEAKVVPGTSANIIEPVLSDDGSWLAFHSFAEGQLKKVPVNGGAPVRLADIAVVFGVHWAEDDTIIYGQPDGIWRVPSTGGTPKQIVKAEDGEQLAGPSLLPGGKWLLFSATRVTGVQRWEEGGIFAKSLETGERKELVRGGCDGRYIRSGHLLYASGSNLIAVPFDPVKVALTGTQVQVLEGVRRASNPSQATGAAHLAVSEQGTLVYVPGSLVNDKRGIALVGRDGAIKPLRLPAKSYSSPRFSPNGRQIAVQTDEPQGGVLWVYDLSGETDLRQLTTGGNNVRPVWTRDGQRITFASDRDGPMSIYWQPANGSGPAERLTIAEPGTEHWPEAWSRDGKTLSFTVVRTNESAIWMFSLESKKTSPFVDEPIGIQRLSTFSPDGKWLAYHSNESGGLFEIFIRPFPSGGVKTQVTHEGRNTPVWSGTGELFYMTVGDTVPLFARTISTDAGLAIGKETTLPIRGFLTLNTNGYRGFDVAPDSQNFLMVQLREGENANSPAARDQINVVLNWFEELNKLVPVTP
jgi:serine/threonine-protein kinase